MGVWTYFLEAQEQEHRWSTIRRILKLRQVTFLLLYYLDVLNLNFNQRNFYICIHTIICSQAKFCPNLTEMFEHMPNKIIGLPNIYTSQYAPPSFLANFSTLST